MYAIKPSAQRLAFPALTSIRQLDGYTLRAIDGVAGTIVDHYFDDGDWRIRYMVVEAGPWLFRRRTLIATDLIGAIDAQRRELVTDIDRGQIEASPPIDFHKPLTRAVEHEHRAFYDIPPYWPTSSVMAAGKAPLVQILDRGGRAGAAAQHLRSTNRVAGYRVSSRFLRSSGRLHDLFFDSEVFTIRYLLLEWRLRMKRGDARPPRTLLPREMLRGIHHRGRRIATLVRHATLVEAPPHQAGQRLTGQYLEHVRRHYATHRAHGAGRAATRVSPAPLRHRR